MPRARHLAEEELLRRMPQATPEERQRLQQLFRQWGLRDDRLTRLRHAPPWQRGYSALVLGRMQVREALPDLLRLLAEPDAELRLAALRALELLGDPDAIEPLVEILAEEKNRAWRLVWAALLTCAQPQPERLLACMTHAEPMVRRLAAAALGEVGSRAALEQLLPFAHDPEPEVRARLAWALGRSRSSRALSVLSELAQDPVWFVRLQAVEALGVIRERSAHEVLLRAVRDPHILVRQKATGSLYLLWRDPVYLIDLLRQEAPDRFALDALVSELEWRGVTWDAIHRVNSSVPTLRQPSQELVRRLIQIGAHPTVFYAIEMHPDTSLRASLLELVAEALPPEGHLDLVQLLASPYLDPGTRRTIEKLVGYPVETRDELV